MKGVTNNRMSHTTGQIPIPWLEISPLQRVLKEREREKEEIIKMISSLCESALEIIPSELREILPFECGNEDR